MFQSRFFWRNFLSYVVIISLTTFVVSYLLTVKTEQFVEGATKESLRDKLVFLIPILRTFDSLSDNTSQQRLFDLTNNINTRITVIDASGKVVIETKVRDVNMMDNHINRPEIIQAAKQGYGTSVRFSDTIKLPMIYSARKIMTHEGLFYIRVGVPYSHLQARLADIRYALGIGAAFGMLVSLLIAVILARRVTEPIAAITRVTEEISHGNYSARLTQRLPRNELGTLGDAINRLASAVQANISQREKMEKIRREFSSNISHELKTPLTSINGYVETLLAGAIHDPEANVRFLHIIKSNVERIITLVTDLLKLSTIEANQGLVHLECVTWQPIIREVVTRHEINLLKKEIALSIDVPENLPAVKGSPRAMSHILDNLIQNAINYTPKGGEICIYARSESDRVIIGVRDTGIGISQADQARIFERFYRVDAARSRDDGGTGLGLAIVKHLVIQIQGSIRVVSELNKGSEFMVALPKSTPT